MDSKCKMWFEPTFVVYLLVWITSLLELDNLEKICKQNVISLENVSYIDQTWMFSKENLYFSG